MANENGLVTVDFNSAKLPVVTLQGIYLKIVFGGDKLNAQKSLQNRENERKFIYETNVVACCEYVLVIKG